MRFYSFAPFRRYDATLLLDFPDFFSCEIRRFCFNNFLSYVLNGHLMMIMSPEEVSSCLYGPTGWSSSGGVLTLTREQTHWRLAVAHMGTAASLRQLGLQARLRCPSCETTYEHPQEGSPREGLQVSKTLYFRSSAESSYLKK